ncbi:MAG: amidase family protein [Pseudomonadota bacterium]
MVSNKLSGLTATEAIKGLREGQFSRVDLVKAAIARIEAVDGQINALPIRCFDRALDRAATLDTDPTASELPLAGLPIAVKDYNDVGGVRTTYGSPIFADNIPERSDATISRLEANGAIPIAKSNVPEWAGGHTFNPVLGLTRNPWNTARSAGGSSGGSAAALASGQVWLATGNDLGGSLRTPAGFNGVVGLRPSPGVVPRGTRLQSFDTLWVEGPMGRCVQDVALMLDAGSGSHADDPLAFDSIGTFAEAAETPAPPACAAFSPDLGVVPMSKAIAKITSAAAGQLAAAGVEMTNEIPDFSGAFDAFQTLRAVLLGTMMGRMLETHRDQINPDIVTNIEKGFDVSPEQIFTAERTRWGLAQHMTRFFETHDVLICPTCSVSPFPVERPYVTEIDGQECETYIDWFAITFLLTLTACPVISLPCGFTNEGLPVGLQLVGPPRGEAKLLRIARWAEAQFGIAEMLPIDPRHE